MKWSTTRESHINIIRVTEVKFKVGNHYNVIKILSVDIK